MADPDLQAVEVELKRKLCELRADALGRVASALLDFAHQLGHAFVAHLHGFGLGFGLMFGLE